MKKALLFILLLVFIQPCAFSAPKKMIPLNNGGEGQLPNIFIYTIPDDTFTPTETEEEEQPQEQVKEVSEDNPITLDDDIVLGATTLKGYAQYIEDEEEIYLKDDVTKLALNIRQPQKISASKGLDFGAINQKPMLKYINEEYIIAPNDIQTSSKLNKNFTVGAQFNNEIDNIAMLETETGLFSKYERNKFALSTSVTKSLNTTYSQDYTTLSVTPEIKFNKYFSLKNVFSADVTRNRRGTKLVLSVTPLAKKENDRLILELGAKQTYYLDSDTSTTQFSFQTKFKL